MAITPNNYSFTGGAFMGGDDTPVAREDIHSLNITKNGESLGNYNPLVGDAIIDIPSDAFVCYYDSTTAAQIHDARLSGKAPYLYIDGIIVPLWKIETGKFTFRTTSTREVDGDTYLDIVDYAVEGLAWSTETHTVSGNGGSQQQAYLKKVSSLAVFDTTGHSGMETVAYVNDVPADGVYQVSVMLSVTPKTASPTKSDLVFQFTGTSGTGMPNTTFHAVVDDSQTFAQQLSFSTTLNLKAGTNSLKMACGGLNTEYLVFVDDLTVAQIVNGVYHNGDTFEEVNDLAEASDFNVDDELLVVSPNRTRKMLWTTLANKVLGFIKSLATTITDFRTGDVIPVDGPSGTAKMGKDDLLKETAQNALAGNVAPSFDPTKPNGDDGYAYHFGEVVVYNGGTYYFKFNKATGAWDSSYVEKLSIVDSSFALDLFARNNGVRNLPSSVYAQNTDTRLMTAVFAVGGGDVIDINVPSGLRFDIMSTDVTAKPYTYTTLETLTAKGSYKFTSDVFIRILVRKTNNGNISPSDVSGVVTRIYQAVLNSETYTSESMLSCGVDLHYGFDRKRKVSPFATTDGSIKIAKGDLRQNSSKILSVAIEGKKGDFFEFDGSSNSSLCTLLTYDGNTYSTIIGPLSKLVYEFTEDTTFYVDLRIIGDTYSVDNFVYGSCVLHRALSQFAMDKLKTNISNVDYFYANVKDGRLVAGKTTNPSNRADYLAVEMNETVKKVGCKWYWNGDYSTKGVVAMAVMRDDWNRKIEGTNSITGKSLHIVCTKSKLKVDFLGNDWGVYYYTNLIDQSLDLDTSANVEHELSVEISGESVTAVLDGVAYNGTNTSAKSMSDVTGKYAMVEHFAQPNSNSVGMPEFTAFRVETAAEIMFDSFRRENGVCYTTPQGLRYINLSNDINLGERTDASYPDW